MKRKLFKKIIFTVSYQLIAISFISAQIGTWTKLTHNAPAANMGVMVLLTNGTVMCHDTIGGTYGTGWDLLTPDATGSYANGTWSTTASMQNDRLFFSTQVLPSGELYVAGGEYGAGTSKGEVYNPATNTWTACGAIPGGWKIYDGNSEILYNGNIVEGPQIGSNSSYNILQWSPSTLNYTTETDAPLNHDEAEWVKLPDSSVLYVGIASQNSCRFIPQTNSWLNDNNVPVKIYDQYGDESGPGVMLPNGNAIFFGATQHNAIYTPTGHATAGTWSAAADFPTINGNLVGQPDAPGAMMVNGHELLAVSPLGTSNNDEWRSPVYFLEYNYTTNTFVQVTSILPGIGTDSIPYGDFGNNCFQVNMLDLPDGNVLVSIDQAGAVLSTEYWIYTPGSAAIPQGKPTINSVYEPSCGIYKVTGKLFNGISEGASYGDDWQMSTNYPLVRLTNGTNVYYATTSNWNRIGAVRTDSLEDTAQFVLPAALPSGTYSLVVAVNGFASNPTLFTYTQFAATAVATANVTCNGQSNGNATVTTSGGFSPYTYNWSNGTSTVSTVNPTGPVLSAGSYTVTVTDPAGCNATAKVTITQPTAVAITIASHVNATCATSGGATANAATGGSSPYTYTWTPTGGTNLAATGLSAGTYTITAADKNGCTGSASATITQAGAIIVTAGTTQNVKCNGGSTGIVSSSVSGGTSPYTYAWTGGSTTSTESALSAGTYTIVIHDKNGCTGTASTTITQPLILSVTASVTANENCNGQSIGKVSSTPSGGTNPYTYAWSGGGTNSTKTGLTSGIYTITITDKNGCTATASANVTQPAQLTVTINIVSNAGCSGNNGRLSSTAGGGTSPYTYSWTGGNTNTSISALSAGTYTVGVTDGNGCTVTASSSITQSGQLTLADSVNSNVLCKGGNNGSATALPSGGVSPYTYLWTGGRTSATATGLTAGNYTVTVKDINGCTGTASVIITQPAANLSITTSVTRNVLCNGGNNGSASASPAGGTLPYTYAWTGGSTNATATGLTAGTYTITLTDAHGCMATASASITQPLLLDVYAAVYTEVSCNGGSNGTASANPAGGTWPYTYTWTGGSTNSTVTGLSTGTYTITLTDANGCTATASVTVTQPFVLSITAGVTTNVLCHGENNGTASANPAGGTMPYTYSWTGGSTNSTATGLSAGTYTVDVTDKNGCAITATAIVTQPPILNLIPGSETTTTLGCIGEAWVGVTGGTASYTYSWSPGGATTDTIKSLCVGNYCCKVTDANGCLDSVCVDVLTGIEGIENPSSIQIYPDPNNGNFTIAGLIRGQIVEIYNYLGQIISNVKADNGTMNCNISYKANGVYLIRILNNDGVLVTEQKIIKTQ